VEAELAGIALSENAVNLPRLNGGSRSRGCFLLAKTAKVIFAFSLTHDSPV
jgi:hypothetical protein